MNKFKFALTKDGYFSHVGTDGTVSMTEEYNLENLPTQWHKLDPETGLLVLDEEAKKAYILEHYAELRVYPDVTDQMDEIMKWLATETEFGIPENLKSMAMQCMSVKSKYPKPETEEV